MKSYIQYRREMDAKRRRQSVYDDIVNKKGVSKLKPPDFAAKSAEIAKNYQKIMESAPRSLKASARSAESEKQRYSHMYGVGEFTAVTPEPNAAFRRHKKRKRFFGNDTAVHDKLTTEEIEEVKGNTPWPEDQEEVVKNDPLSEDDSLWDIEDEGDYGIYANEGEENTPEDGNGGKYVVKGPTVIHTVVDLTGVDLTGKKQAASNKLDKLYGNQLESDED